ncbi:hypothetical protein CHS0354_021676 [Potamilus streckersoni]|uniref:Pentatricopeptide repeat-containing protein n=1 Tax=Potamilus streckersoni TaxID=2493646 RepID=A0AAE0SHY7_9BIVA|nr:hypothetical protein CHS0354_021676 [Potamilus streckersoni]
MLCSVRAHIKHLYCRMPRHSVFKSANKPPHDACVVTCACYATLQDRKKGSSKHENSEQDEFSARKFKSTRQSVIVTEGKTETKRWADVFGTLSQTGTEEKSLEFHGDENDVYEDDLKDMGIKPHRRLSTTDRRHPPEWYAEKVKSLEKEGKIREAIRVFEVWMLEEDRVMPTEYVFRIVIGMLGRVGYTKKSFMLFNKMKQMGIQPSARVYTSLFNACSNSPWKEDGLSRAKQLRELMTEKDIEPSFITMKAMIKAFGMCGDLETAFIIMDEASKKYRLDQECFSYLIMACISDKEAGFHHTIQVWRMMRRKNVVPNLDLYNLLLRAIRDCGMGQISAELDNCWKQLPCSMNQLEESVPNIASKSVTIDDKKKLAASRSYKEQKGSSVVYGSVQNKGSSTDGTCAAMKDTAVCYSEEGQKMTTLELCEDLDRFDVDSHQSKNVKLDKTSASVANSNLILHQSKDTRLDKTSASVTKASYTVFPNILDPNADLSKIVAVKQFENSKEGRLSLVGGFQAILDQMSADKVKPDIRIFSQLISVLPKSLETEEKIQAVMDQLKVSPDIDFFNMLIHERCLRSDLTGARDVVRLIAARGLVPNMMTFGCLAMTCRKKEDALKLLSDIDAAGMCPSVETMGTLFHCSYMDFNYKIILLQKMDELGIKPNKMLIEHIEKSITVARLHIVESERGGSHGNKSSYYSSAFFRKNFEQFQSYYSDWLKRVEFAASEHPWKPFRYMQEQNKV